MLIELNNVSHIYSGEQSTKALDSINLEIRSGEFVGLIGNTGSGKSTLVQILNGLLEPTEGNVLIDGKNVTSGEISSKQIRQNIGLVFQYPEHQLFEESVFKDVAFGPRKLGLKEGEVKKRVRESLSFVDLSYEKIFDRSPFNLSGGQQRRVAIAGVISMNPRVLILDEPTAGLDPLGRKKLMNLLESLHRERKITIVLISHRMEEIATLATKVIVLNNGHIKLRGTPEKVFSKREKLKEIGLGTPQITEILYQLRSKGLKVKTDIFSIAEASKEILKQLGRREINVN